MLINHYTDHKQHTTQPPTPNKPGANSRGLLAQQVLNVNPTACLLPELLYPTQKTHPHPPPKQAVT